MTFQSKNHSYEEEHILGQGSFGSVYLVEESQTKKKYALKLFERYYEPFEGWVEPEDFEIETKFGEHIKKSFGGKCASHVICVYDYAISPQLFIVYELMSGDILEYNFQNTQEIVRAMKESLIGLEQIHKAKLAHNDIKPENILYKKEGGKSVFKIGDLGALCSSKTIIGFKRDCKAFGTPWYSAPEVNGYFDLPTNYKILQKADVFALASAFYYVSMRYIQGNQDTESNKYRRYLYDKESYEQNVFENIYKRFRPAKQLTQRDFQKSNLEALAQNQTDKKYFRILDHMINRMMVVDIKTRPTAREAFIELNSMTQNLLSSNKSLSPKSKTPKSPKARTSKSPKSRTPKLPHLVKKSPKSTSVKGLRRSPRLHSPTYKTPKIRFGTFSPL